MNRDQLEHVIRASAAITRQEEFIVIGSQSVLGAHPDAPAELLRSMDLDLYPKDDPDASILIDGAIGEGSTFHETFGYYAHGIGPETAVLPKGWEERLIPVTGEGTHGATAWCLEPADLAVSKLVAGREQDREFVTTLLSHGLVEKRTVEERLATVDVSEEQHAAIAALLRGLRS